MGTGLLVARRLLQKLNLHETYVGQEKVDGDEFYIESEEDGPGAFRCYLDTGLNRTSTGARVFGALKGAVDGGKNIGSYMDSLKEEDDAAFQRQFSKYIKEGINSENIEEMYSKCHAAIREDPSCKEKAKEAFKGKRWNRKKMSLAQRKDSVAQKKAAFLKKMEEDDE